MFIFSINKSIRDLLSCITSSNGLVPPLPNPIEASEAHIYSILHSHSFINSKILLLFSSIKIPYPFK